MIMKIHFVLLIFFSLFSSNLFAEEISHSLRFVFSDSGPPYSYLSESSILEGITPDLVRVLIDLSTDVISSYEAYPWKRAQYLVENSNKDAFCTYPSESRKGYAFFTTNPLYFQEYGYLIFNKDNDRAGDLIEIDDISDLNDFVFVSQSGIAWEEDNIPKSVQRIYVTTPEQLLHILFGRDSGDFFIMNLEQALYYSKKLGYEDKILFNRVDFIPDSSIPFHIGIRKNFPEAIQVIKTFDQIIVSNEYIHLREDVLKKYR